MASRSSAPFGPKKMLKWQRTQKIMALVPPAKAPSDDSSTSEDEVIINNYTKPKKQQSSDSEHNYESSEPRSYPSEIDDLSLDSHSEDEIPATPSPRPLQLQNESKSYLPNSKENSRPTTPPSPTPPQQNDCNIPEVPCSEVQTPISSASMPQDIMNDSILHIPTIPLSPLINQMFSPGPSNQPLPFTLNSVSSVLSPNMSPAAPNTRSKRRQNTKPKHPAAKKVKKFVRKPLSFKFRAGKLQYAAIFEPPKHDFSPDPHHSILDYFTDFFPNDIFELIVEQTNLYSVQTDSRSINITNDDVKDFIAITLIMGVVKMPSYRDYWSRFLRYPAVADIMPLKKYEKIRKYLHFADNSNINDDRYYKVRPIIEKIRLNCLKMKEEQRYSVDEMMVPYKGTRAGSRRQYLPKKPKKWGMKLFVRAGVSGLVYDFIPYGGEDTFRNHSFTEYEESLGLGAKVVLALCKTIEDKPAVVYFDNFFTSLELIHHLRQEYGIFSLGTIKSNRLRGCQNKLLADKVLAKKGRGASSQIVCNDTKLAVVRWYDNKPVTLASSFVDSHPMGKIQRYSKDTKSRVEVNCPQIVKQYNAHMGGVDLADMLIALYRSNFKTKRWYMTMFSQSLDICVNNAWLLHRRDHADPKDRLPLKKFRIQIVSELLHKNRTRVTVSQENDPPKKIITPAAPRPTDAVRYDNNGHLPMFVSYGRCKYCKNGYTNITCSKCILRLCLVSKRNCFYNYRVK